MKITTLGYYGAYPHNEIGTTSFLLESDGFKLLLDCGSRAVSELEKYCSPLEIDAVILSHYHHDHIADLGVLQYYRQLWPKEQWEPKILPIYGHTEDANHFKDLTLPGVSEGIAYSAAEPLEIGPYMITFLKTIHPVPCFAMRFVEKTTGKVFVFTGDSGFLEDFVDFAKNADLFLADTYLFEGAENHFAHFTSKESGVIAKKANVKHLVLTHLPQHGNLEELKEEAQKYAGNIPVSLTEKGKVFTL